MVLCAAFCLPNALKHWDLPVVLLCCLLPRMVTWQQRQIMTVLHILHLVRNSIVHDACIEGAGHIM